MPRRSVDLLAPAREEIGEVFDWYLARSPRAAARFLNEIDRAIALIVEAPEIWPRFEIDTRRYPLRSFPFDLLYRELGGAIQVVAVAHQRRRPGYWRSRIDE